MQLINTFNRVQRKKCSTEIKFWHNNKSNYEGVRRPKVSARPYVDETGGLITKHGFLPPETTHQENNSALLSSQPYELAFHLPERPTCQRPNLLLPIGCIPGAYPWAGG